PLRLPAPGWERGRQRGSYGATIDIAPQWRSGAAGQPASTAPGVQGMELEIARCRLVLSVAAIGAMYVDPAAPLLSRWIPMATGSFTMDAHLLLVMTVHLIYSALFFVGLRQRWDWASAAAGRTTGIDVAFGVAITVLTEGMTSPSYPFFAFAVVEAG